MPSDLPPLPEAVAYRVDYWWGDENEYRQHRLFDTEDEAKSFAWSLLAIPSKITELRAFGHACRVVTLSEAERASLEWLEWCVKRAQYPDKTHRDMGIVCAALRRLGGSP